MKRLAWADEKVERIIGVLLQAGVVLSGIVVMAGGVLYLIHFGHSTENYHTFVGESMGLRSIPSVVRGAFHMDPRAVIQLGLLLLIATPVARVLFSIVAFWMERDRVYVLVTFVVLAILLFGLLGGTL